MKKSKKIETKNVSGVVEVSQKLGDALATDYNESKDLKFAQTALSAYKTAISGAKAQMIYKKMQSSNTKIKFFED